MGNRARERFQQLFSGDLMGKRYNAIYRQLSRQETDNQASRPCLHSMRLGVDARPLAHTTSGIGRYTQAILKAIVAQTDWSVTLFCDARTSVDVPRCEIVPVGNLLGSTTGAFHTRTAKAIRRKKIDVFFAPRHHLPLGLTTPSVVTIHDMVWQTHPETMLPTNLLAEKLFMPRAVHTADAIIAVSQNTERDLLTYLPVAKGKTTVIYEAPCTTDPVYGALPTDKPFVLAVGTQEPRKNHERLIEAFARIALQHPDTCLVIAGGKGWKTDLASVAERLAITDRVIFLNSIAKGELEALYASCVCLALPSLYEGFGLPLVEAMQFGKPILTSNLGSMPEVAGDAAVLVSPVDVDDIARGLDKLLSNAVLRGTLGAHSRERAGLFSWERAGTETIAVIDRVASSNLRQ